MGFNNKDLDGMKGGYGLKLLFFLLLIFQVRLCIF
jgi:hypothetical protein